jgi:hypothetical protein
MCDTKKHVEKREDEICLKNLDPVGHDQPAYSVVVVVVAHSFHSSLAHFLDRKTSFTAEKEEEEAGGRTLLQGLYL